MAEDKKAPSRAAKALGALRGLGRKKPDEAPKPADSADALALAICHIWRGSGDSKLAAALAVEKSRLSKLVRK